MTGAMLLKMAKELEGYYTEFDECCCRSEGRAMLRRYARGQLGPLERKSIEPIADAEGIKPRAMQFFFQNNGFDEEAILDLHQRRVAREIGGRDGIFVIDETSDAKKGEWTAGVAKQYCGESGKLDQCIVTVHTAYVRENAHCLLDGTLFMPECWNPSQATRKKRRRADVPAEIVHVPKTELALSQLRHALENGVPGRYVTADALYGGAPWWRVAVAELGLMYVVEVPSRVQGWIGERRGPARSLATLAAKHPGLRKAEARAYRTHETDKGPEVWQVRRTTFVEQAEAAPAQPQILLVAWNVRTGERKFFLANAERTIKTEVLLKVAFARWRVERCFQDAKGEVGLNHAEMRTYRGLRRHLILTAINHYFLVTRVRRAGEKGPDPATSGGRTASDSRTDAGRDHDLPTTGATGGSLGEGHRADADAQPQIAKVCAQAASANAA